MAWLVALQTVELADVACGWRHEPALNIMSFTISNTTLSATVSIDEKYTR
jgi:hypothetical protein